MIYEFNPKEQRFAVEIGIPNKLERLNNIPRPRPNEKIAMCINANIFDWTGKANDGYGEIEQNGVQYKPVAPGYPVMSFKNGKMAFGDIPGADVGVQLAMLLVLNGKVDIRNPASMTVGKDQRTAVGQKDNGIVGFVTVDNMTTQRLAEYMLKLGYIIAFQCDSGGSTGYYDGKTLRDQGRPVAAALVAYKPKLIAIDDGHGMETPGKRTPKFADGSFMHENEFNAAVAKLLKAKLQSCGFDTLMVAEGDRDTPLKTRTDRANNAQADLYLSIHANALTGVWGPHGGIETYYYLNSVQGKKLADIIHKHLLKGAKLADRKVQTAKFYVLAKTKMPSVLVELGFMDNPVEAKLLLSDSYRSECAEELASGICEFYGVEQMNNDDFDKAIKLLGSIIPIGYDYWSKKKDIDPYFSELMIKIAAYVERGN